MPIIPFIDRQYRYLHSISISITFFKYFLLLMNYPAFTEASKCNPYSKIDQNNNELPQTKQSIMILNNLPFLYQLMHCPRPEIIWLVPSRVSGNGVTNRSPHSCAPFCPSPTYLTRWRRVRPVLWVAWWVRQRPDSRPSPQSPAPRHVYPNLALVPAPYTPQ